MPDERGPGLSKDDIIAALSRLNELLDSAIIRADPRLHAAIFSFENLSAKRALSPGHEMYGRPASDAETSGDKRDIITLVESLGLRTADDVMKEVTRFFQSNGFLPKTQFMHEVMAEIGRE